MMFTISTLDLESWADTIGARAEVARLISRLIWATCPDLQFLEMRGGEQAETPGLDGRVVCSVGNRFVPAGTSAWELTTSRDTLAKANADYRNRTSKVGAVIRANATFVFATPRRFPKAVEWANRKDKERKWKAVRLIDSHQLEQWLDLAPWVAADFARITLRKAVNGMQSLAAVWDEYATVPIQPPRGLCPEFVIAGRLDIRDKFLDWLTSNAEPENRMIRLCGNSIHEICHFLAASIQELPEIDRNRFFARVFCVEGQEAADTLRGINDSHTIIAACGHVVPPIVKASRTWGCKVVLIDVDKDTSSTPTLPWLTSLSLGPIRPEAMIKAAVEMGFLPSDAERLCLECGFDYERIRRAVFLC